MLQREIGTFGAMYRQNYLCEGQKNAARKIGRPYRYPPGPACKFSGSECRYWQRKTGFGRTKVSAKCSASYMIAGETDSRRIEPRSLFGCITISGSLTEQRTSLSCSKENTSLPKSWRTSSFSPLGLLKSGSTATLLKTTSLALLFWTLRLSIVGANLHRSLLKMPLMMQA